MPSTRRDYLRILLAAGATPSISVEKTGDDEVDFITGDNDVYWSAMAAAAAHDDPDEAVNVLGAIWAAYNPDVGLSVSEFERHVRRAARGEEVKQGDVVTALKIAEEPYQEPVYPESTLDR